MKISVVIPTLNEAGHILQTLDNIYCSARDFFEVIVVDGGSVDNTEEICTLRPCRFVRSDQAGRGYQMNLGAKEASGDVLLFLHADSLLPPKAAQAIQKALKDPLVGAGGFSKIFDTDHVLLRGGVARCKLRYRILRAIAGDQGLFVRTSTFRQVAGFPNVPIMEEFILCKRLRQKGRLVLLPQCVTTSARRFLEQGVIRCYLRMALVSGLYYLNVPTAILKRLYYAD